MRVRVPPRTSLFAYLDSLPHRVLRGGGSGYRWNEGEPGYSLPIGEHVVVYTASARSDEARILLGELGPSAATPSSRTACMTLSAAKRLLATMQAGGESARSRLPLHLRVVDLLAGDDADEALLRSALGEHFDALHDYAQQELMNDRCTLAVDGFGQLLDSVRLRLLLLRLVSIRERHPRLPIAVTYDPGAGSAPVIRLSPCAVHDLPCWIHGLAWTEREASAAYRRFSATPGNSEGRKLTRFVYGVLRDKGEAEELVSRELSILWEGRFHSFDPARYRGTRCPFQNWIYRVVRNAALRQVRKEFSESQLPPPPPSSQSPSSKRALEVLVAALDRDFVRTATRLGEFCLEARRRGGELDEPELGALIDYASQQLGHGLEDDRGEWREAAGLALAKMGLVSSLWYRRLGPLDQETLSLCLYRNPPLEPASAAAVSTRPCRPVAMRQRLFQALRRLADGLRTAKGPA
jgi:hypothetical protein